MSKKLLLRVEAPHFVAGAVFEKSYSKGWGCTQAAPIIKWMIDKIPTEIHLYLVKKGWRWEWLDVTY